MSKTAIIFGGHGFIGSHLADQLLQSGNYSRIVCADIAQAPRFRISGVEYVYCDVRENIPIDIVPFVDEIYNLAAIHVTPGYEDWEYFWTNILGATNICRYAASMNVDTIVFTSSISVYGPSEEPQSEESPLHPDSAYGRSKVAAELIHRQWRHEMPERRRLIIARPAVIFGWQEHGNFTRLAAHLKRGTFVYPGRKETIKSCGYVKDLVGSFAYFLSQPIGEITYNFGFTERFTTEDICCAFTKAAGYKPPKWIVPIQVITMAGLAFEILGKLGLKTSINRARVMKLYRSTNIIPKQLDAFGFARKFSLQEALVNWKQQSEGDRFE